MFTMSSKHSGRWQPLTADSHDQACDTEDSLALDLWTWNAEHATCDGYHIRKQLHRLLPPTPYAVRWSQSDRCYPNICVYSGARLLRGEHGAWGRNVLRWGARICLTRQQSQELFIINVRSLTNSPCWGQGKRGKRSPKELVMRRKLRFFCAVDGTEWWSETVTLWSNRYHSRESISFSRLQQEWPLEKASGKLGTRAKAKHLKHLVGGSQNVLCRKVVYKLGIQAVACLSLHRARALQVGLREIMLLNRCFNSILNMI